MMPIGIITIKCQDCGYIQVCNQTSDVVFSPISCCRCRSQNLKVSKNTFISKVGIVQYIMTALNIRKF